VPGRFTLNTTTSSTGSNVGGCARSFDLSLSHLSSLTQTHTRSFLVSSLVFCFSFAAAIAFRSRQRRR
jgi:hypothetical protein